MSDPETTRESAEATFTDYAKLLSEAQTPANHELAVVPAAVDTMPEIGTEVAERQKALELQIEGILDKNVDSKYEQLIVDVRAEKLAWVNSAEFARRIKLTGADDADVVQIQDWVRGNLESGKVHVLEPDDMGLLKAAMGEYARSAGVPNSVEQGEAFNVSDSLEGAPESVLGAVFVPDTSVSERPGFTIGGPKTEQLLRHELGHQAQDGVLESELYKDWAPRFKEGARDPEYIGLLRETDTRVRSMFTVLGDSFNPQTTAFGPAQIEQLQQMRAERRLSNDTDVTDLLDHYDDAELMHLANTLPAI